MRNPACRILGIDPGSRTTGYGIIEKDGPHLEFVTCGTIKTDRSHLVADRLLEIHAGLSEVIARHTPDVAALEDIFVAKNARSALKLGQARGVAILAAIQANLTTHDYPARMVKQAVVGYGRADKTQVQHMVRILLNLSATPSSDAADALAVAICHAHQMGTLLTESGRAASRSGETAQGKMKKGFTAA